ncbi:MAG: hypothetical protein SWE60_00560 [Thermodesulfobacteriota bacterium]|nr:hypothetical protein [Thermodesulfobacteriota bacterium]
MAPSSGKATGGLFLVLLWAAFVLPKANWAAFQFVVGHTTFSELSLILMPFIYALYPRQRAFWHTKQLRTAIVAFFASCVFCNLAQYLLYGGSITSFCRVHRALIPLYCAMALLYLGPRIRPKAIIGNLGACLSVSFLISLVFFFFDIDFTPFFNAELTEEAYELIRSGRLYNVNAGFGYVALTIIAAFCYYRKKLPKRQSNWLLLFASALSVLASILTYNRTFLVILPLLIAASLLTFFRLRVAFYFILGMCFAVLLGLYGYYQYDRVQRQVDQRIILPLKHQEILENVYYGKREVLYEGYFDLAKEYALTGVPPDVPLAVVGFQSREVVTTDISFATVLLRNGVFSFMAYLWAGFLVYRNLWKIKDRKEGPTAKMLRRSLLLAIPFMLAAGLNIDILARHYPVVFVVLLVTTLRADNTDQMRQAG